jgi:hypothetical protein
MMATKGRDGPANRPKFINRLGSAAVLGTAKSNFSPASYRPGVMASEYWLDNLRN